MKLRDANYKLLLAPAILSAMLAAPAIAQDLYVADYGIYGDPSYNVNANNIKIFSPTGSYLNTITGGMVDPAQMAFNGSGDLLVTNQGINAVTEYTRSGDYLGIFASTGVNLAQGLAIDKSGNVYVGNDGNVTKYSSTGAYLGVFASTNTGPGGIAQLAFAPNGDLYCTNEAQNTVTIYSSTGSYLKTISNGTVPFALLFDGSDDLYVSYYGSQTIDKYDAAGDLVNSFSTGSVGPCGLAFDAAGNLLVADAPANDVVQFTTSGTNLGVFASGGLAYDYQIAIQPAVVSTPEPSSLAIFGLGLLAVARKRLSGRKSA